MRKQIDLKQLIAGKNPKLARRMPRFLLAYLNRILHIQEINQFLDEHYDVWGLDFALDGLQFLDMHFTVEGRENLEGTTRPLIVGNHPLGGLDGIALLTLVAEDLGDVKLLVNDFLMALENLRELFVPINKHGSNRTNRKAIDAVIQSDNPLIIFPAGVCSRKLPYGIYDLEWNKSFIKMARNGERDIIPVYIGGKNSRFFYNLARLRHRLGIKANIEMLYLVDEMFKQRHATLDIVIGKPIGFNTFTDGKTDWLWARHLREFVYTMKDGVPAVFNPDAELTLPESYFG